MMEFVGLQILALIVVIILASATSTPPNFSLAKPNCPEYCGNIRIPFPFGISKDCCLNDEFLIKCNTSTYDPPKAYFMVADERRFYEITNISLDGQLKVLKSVAYDCYDRNQNRNKSRIILSLRVSPYTVNNTANKFTVVGCDTYAYVSGVRRPERYFQTGCIAMCRNKGDLENGACTGSGCCQMSFPKDVFNVGDIKLNSIWNYVNVSDFNDCGFAFVADQSAFNFSRDSIINLKNVTKLPVVIDWDIGKGINCGEAKMNISSYACKSMNSECKMPGNGDGYRCFCQQGYHGNPYLDDGCKDIDECQDGNHDCEEQRCVNTPGNYTCICPKGYHGDGRKDGKGCIRGESPLVKIVGGVALGVSILLLSTCWGHLEFNRRKHIKMKEKFFLQNGGELLQQKLIGKQSSSNTTRIFSASELKKATNNFHNSMIIGQGGHGTVYKGVLPDEQKVIAIKKSKRIDPNEIDQFINEVVVLSQINHRNVVKLLGCCLETEAPQLVYEFIDNGTLYQHIHKKEILPALSWDMRLRIATETAGVLSYLHSWASTPIIHRDIKTANILLDRNCTAKVADFGASRLVPRDHSLLSTLVQGTFGYLDPEYLQSQQLTEKSDVYSFGVVLVELLTGRNAVIKDGPEEDRNLANFFVRVMREGRLFEVVEDNLMREGDKDQVVMMKVAALARRCVNVRGEDRPFMKEVSMELEALRVGGKHPWIDKQGIAEEYDESLLSEGFSGIFMDSDGNNTSSTSVGFHRLES